MSRFSRCAVFFHEAATECIYLLVLSSILPHVHLSIFGLFYDAPLLASFYSGASALAASALVVCSGLSLYFKRRAAAEAAAEDRAFLSSLSAEERAVISWGDGWHQVSKDLEV